MPNIFDVANYILNIFDGNLSKMKLQKLCYYAQAWHLAFNGKPLFDEDFLRWDNGPVCYRLWKKFENFSCIDYKKVLNGALTEGDMEPCNYGAIDYALETYGEMDGNELSRQTHSEDPWKKTGENEIIRKDSIMNYYFGKWGEDDIGGMDRLSKYDAPYGRDELDRRIKSASTCPVYESIEDAKRALEL
jgi:uncharacterized phage-associated protein